MIPTSTGMVTPALSDRVQPVFELLHIPAELSHDVIRAVVLFLFQNSDIGTPGFGMRYDLQGNQLQRSRICRRTLYERKLPDQLHS